MRGALQRAEKTEAELRYLADHDSLTGLLDRRRFRSELDSYVSFSARYGGQGAVMIIDIDGLKAVNDSLGHHAGDNLIRQIARILRERVRTTDIVARLSGDELAVLMPQTDTEGALQLGEDLRAQVAESARPAPEADPVTISVGITMFGSEHAGGPEAVLVAADQAMYRAKEDGRNQIALFSDPGESKAQGRRPQTTTARIRDALTHDRLSLHTPADPQPRLRRHRALRAAAADDRRRRRAAAGLGLHRRRGALRDDPGARPLGRRPGPRGARPARARGRPGLPARQPLRRLAGRPLGARVHRAAARRRGRRPRRAAPSRSPRRAKVDDYARSGGFADRLTEFGCQVAIDDYGSGFGPFHYLKELPFDVIKIDGEFVRDMPRSDADQLTVQAIVQIARGLGKTTIAEYVQDDATADLLREYGVDMAQGFHLGRPVALAEGLAA